LASLFICSLLAVGVLDARHTTIGTGGVVRIGQDGAVEPIEIVTSSDLRARLRAFFATG
jgi:hypothetical protein